MKSLLASLCLILLLTACSPIQPLSPTETPAPTSAPTATPTLRPPATLPQDTALYAGPGNAGYAVAAQLKAGTVVYPLGTYGDFVPVAVEASGDKVAGFVWKGALGVIPHGLKEWPVTDVPWQPVFILNNFVSPQTIFQGQAIQLVNTQDGYYDVEGLPILLDSPFMLRLQLQVSGATSGAVKLLGIPERAAPSWWQGIRRLDVAIANGSLQLGLRDGTSADFQTTISLPVPAGQVLSLLFQDPQGQAFTVLDQEQRAVMTVAVATLPGLQLRDGLFPEQKLYLGASAAPHSTLTITALELR